jgi:hypothetical protein
MSAAVLRSKRAARGESAAGAKAVALRTRGKSAVGIKFVRRIRVKLFRATHHFFTGWLRRNFIA